MKVSAPLKVKVRLRVENREEQLNSSNIVKGIRVQIAKQRNKLFLNFKQNG